MSSNERQKLSKDLLDDEVIFINHAKPCAFIVQEHEL
jgi:hypothetical protein